MISSLIELQQRQDYYLEIQVVQTGSSLSSHLYDDPDLAGTGMYRYTLSSFTFQKSKFHNMSAASSSGREVYVQAHRTSYVSHSGMIAVLESVKKFGLPDTVSRRALKRTRREPIEGIMSDVELEMIDGSTKSFPVLHPIRALVLMFQTCSSFASFFNQCLETSPSKPQSPWRLVLYCDEVLPGNALKPTNERKLVAWYWSFLEYGARIHQECLWMHCLALRSSQLKRIKGGYGQVFAKLLDLFFGDPDLRLGIQLGPTLFFAKIACVVGDEVALKLLWSFKGASGTMICFRCSNVVNHTSKLDLHDPSGTLVPSSTVNLSTCRLHTDGSIEQNAQALAGQLGILTKSKFAELEQSMGLTYCDRGVLWMPQMSYMPGLISVGCFDWMHIMVVNGAWNSEVGHLFEAIQAEISSAMMHGYLMGLNWPRRTRSKAMTGKRAFEKRTAASGALACSASEGLSLYPCIRQFLRDNLVDPATNGPYQSYLALCGVLDLLSKSRTWEVSPADLAQAVETWLGHRLVQYGAASFQPKVHYCLHLADQLERFGRLVSCWCHERKHKELKRFANQMHAAKASTSWEKSLLEEVALMQRLQLEEFDAGPFAELVNEKPADAALTQLCKTLVGCGRLEDLSVMASDQARVHYELFGKGDVCTFELEGSGTCVGEIWFHLSAQWSTGQIEHITILSQWNPTGARNQYRITNVPCAVPSSSLLHSMPWLRVDADTASIVVCV